MIDPEQDVDDTAESIRMQALTLTIVRHDHSAPELVFLERTGDRIGEDRFRVSEASFVCACNSPTDIEHRIDEFHRLIATEPAGHWEELFSRIRQRARPRRNLSVRRFTLRPVVLDLRRKLFHIPAR